MVENGRRAGDVPAITWSSLPDAPEILLDTPDSRPGEQQGAIRERASIRRRKATELGQAKVLRCS
jgi:hypothetical protein